MGGPNEIGGSMNEAIRMQLSAFVDGELPDNEKELLLRRLSQDAELRRELGEYLAIGRAMRGELRPAGVDLLRDRIDSAIESGEGIELPDEDVASPDRRLRPLAGFAIAASVALLALVGLQMYPGATSIDVQDVDLTAVETQTQPSTDELFEQLRQHHDAAGDENHINTVLTSIEIGREAIEDQEDDSDAEPPESVLDDADTEAPAVE